MTSSLRHTEIKSQAQSNRYSGCLVDQAEDTAIGRTASLCCRENLQPKWRPSVVVW